MLRWYPLKVVVSIRHLGRSLHVAVASAAVPLREDAGHDKEEDERESDGERD